MATDTKGAATKEHAGLEDVVAGGQAGGPGRQVDPRPRLEAGQGVDLDEVYLVVGRDPEVDAPEVAQAQALDGGLGVGAQGFAHRGRQVGGDTHVY